jgi:hypothetical protein
MKARRFTAVVLALGIAAGAAACGGDESVVTVTTDQLPTTAAATTDTSTTPTTLAAPTTAAEPTTEATADLTLAQRLPPEDAMPGTTPGTPRNMPEASDLTATLYSPGDPAQTPAAEALEANGYAGGILRDDTGTDPRNDIALFRSYVMELGGETEAEAEVTRSVDEVIGTTVLETGTLDVPGIPGARGVTAQGSQSGQTLSVVFIAFPAGPYVYGLQAVATSADAIDTDRMLSIAQDQYAQATG